nr:hypothetical protein [Tanacetum cinerariifolium]
MSTPIDFSAYVIKNLKIDNLTQDILVGPTFNLLKGTCKSHVELEYNIKECYKAVTNRLDWNNPKGNVYPFDLSKPLPLIMHQGRQVVPDDFFIKNDLECFRCIVILKHVENLQLEVKSYQKKLNITKPETYRSDISKRTPYTIYKNRQGIIYVDKYKRSRLMFLDDLYKFSDMMLTSIRDVLHDITANPRMDYLPKRK